VRWCCLSFSDAFDVLFLVFVWHAMQIRAETQKQLRELRASREKLLIELSQETENARLLIKQNETEIAEVRQSMCMCRTAVVGA